MCERENAVEWDLTAEWLLQQEQIQELFPVLYGSRVPTWQQLLDTGVSLLSKAGVADAKLDAWYLLAEAFHTDRVHFFLDRSRPVFGERLEKGLTVYREFLLNRAKRIPLQQLLGRQDFMGLTFLVDDHVLIPRQDTETLVEQVLKEHRSRDISVLDMCTGSGCIGISLAILGGYGYVRLVDKSPEALKVAKKNGQRLFLLREKSVKAETMRLPGEPWQFCLTTCMAQPGAQSSGDIHRQSLILAESDMFSALDEREKYDVIVSNPPYIPSAVIEELAPEVRDYEPLMALDGAADGLYFYRILAEKSKIYLKEGGNVYFEIGYNQAKEVTSLLQENGYEDIRTLKDAAEHDRVVAGVWKKAYK